MKIIPTLYYEITGSGPTIILLHGYMASTRYWDKATTHLAGHHTVIAMDLLGFGNSPKPLRSRYDFDDQIASINATLAGIGVSKKFTLIGHSMGSLVSLRYAKQYPERLTKLLLTNMPIFASPAEARQDIYSTRKLYRLMLQPGIHGTVWPLFALIMRLRLIPEKVTGNMREHRKYMFQSNGPSRLRSMRNIIFTGMVEADLKALRVKTVLLSGLSDRAPYLRNLQQFSLGTNILVRNVTGGHHLPQTQPELLIELL
jgi:pimeloyl-ACP methyl ester carboxylesterase